MLDVRKPIGFLFTIIGAILTVYAVASPQITKLVVEATKEEITLNLNFPCGISMLLFGILMLVLAYTDKGAKASASKTTEPAAH